MKPKESSLKVKLFLGISLCATVVLAGLRIWQMIGMIDAETGFYVENLGFNRFVSYAVAVLCVCMTVCCFLLRRGGTSRETAEMKNGGAFVGALLFGIGLLVDVFQAFLIYKSGDGLNNATGTGLRALMTSGRLMVLGEMLFGLLSAVYFFMLAGDFRKGRNNAAKQPILALTPMLWASARLVHHFLVKISFIRVSDLFFELLLFGYMALFFLYLAQVNSNVYREGFEWRLFGFGLPAALLAGMLNLPRLILTFAHPDSVISSYPLRPADLLFCVFAFLLCFALLKQPMAEYRKPTDEKTGEK